MQVTFNGDTVALDGEVDCSHRRDMLAVVAREYAPVYRYETWCESPTPANPDRRR